MAATARSFPELTRQDGGSTGTAQGRHRLVTATARWLGLLPADAPRPQRGFALTVEPGYPDGLDEHAEEDGCAGRKVVQQREDVDAALEEGCPLDSGCRAQHASLGRPERCSPQGDARPS